MLPTQSPDVTTSLTRLKPYDILVMLNETAGAVGDLYCDDGDTIDTFETGLYNYVQFQVASQTLRSSVLHWNYQSPSPSDSLQDVTILGVMDPVTAVNVNGLPYHNFTYNSDKKVLFIRSLNLSLKDSFSIDYQ